MKFTENSLHNLIFLLNEVLYDMRKFTIKEIHLNIHEKIFFFAYLIYLVSGILSTTFYYQYYVGTLHTLILFGCILILIINETFANKYTLKTLIILILCILLCGIVSLKYSGFNNMLCVIVFMYAARNIKFDKIARITIPVSLLILIFVIVSAKLGIITNYVFKRNNGVSREYLGFLYALYPSAIIFNIIGLYLYTHKEKLKIINIGLLCIFNYYIYRKTNSRLSFFLSLVMIIVCIICDYKEKIISKSRVLKKFVEFSYVIAATLSLYMTFSYNSSIVWMRKLNKFLGDRLYIGQSSLIKYGISLLGNNKIEWSGNGLDAYGNVSTSSYSWVDCLYLQVLQKYGIIFAIALLTLITVCMIKLVNQKKYLLAILLASIAFRSMIDDLSLMLFFNSFWLPLGEIFIKKSTINKKKRIKWKIK